MEASFKVCPLCKCEYRLEVELCADCHVSLQYPNEIRAPSPEPEALAEAEGEFLVRTDQVDYIRGLAEHLVQRGIPFRIGEQPQQETGKGRFGWSTLCSLYVRSEQAEAALEAEREFARAMMPEMADRLQLREIEAHACPACGAALPREANECRSCGLEFPDAEPEGGTKDKRSGGSI